MPTWSARTLLITGAVVMVARYVINVVNSIPTDVAYASVAGADRILHGQELYTAVGGHADTYGPIAYLSYVPFTAILPFHGLSDLNLVPAHAGVIVFDALVALTLFLIGRRLRPGQSGLLLGAALAYAWITSPLSWYVVAWSTNDDVVALFVLLALLEVTHPIRGGLLMGLAGMTKFGPFALLPLFAVADRPGRRWTGVVIYVAAALVASVALILLFLPPGGFKEFYDATIGYQLTRKGDPFSVWGLHPNLETLQSVVRVAAVLFALALAAFAVWRPRRPQQIAALGGAAMIASQLPLWHWSELYMVWFAGLAFVGVFTRYSTEGGGRQEAISPG